MSNKYLEKIAGARSFRSPFNSLMGAGLTSLKNLGKGVGNQFHNAFGGAYRDYAQNTLGITNPAHLARTSSVRSMAREYYKKNPIGTNLTRAQRSTNFRNTVHELQDKTNSGRLGAGVITAGSLVAGNALLNRANNNQQNQGYNNGVYY